VRQSCGSCVSTVNNLGNNCVWTSATKNMEQGQCINAGGSLLAFNSTSPGLCPVLSTEEKEFDIIYSQFQILP
jgi:hypothetical protein